MANIISTGIFAAIGATAKYSKRVALARNTKRSYVRKMITWHLEKRLVKELKPHPKNPRQLSKDQERHLNSSINKFGLAEKPIINTDSTIIGGHQRLQILKKQKVKEIECWVPERELNSAEVDELNVRLNKNTGSFDFDILANQFEIPDLLEWGFSVDDLDIGSLEDIESEQKESKKKKSTCPNCGHEY